MNTNYQVGDLFLCNLNHGGRRCGCYGKISAIYEDGTYSVDYYSLNNDSITNTNQRVLNFKNACFIYLGKNINKLHRLLYA